MHQKKRILYLLAMLILLLTGCDVQSNSPAPSIQVASEEESAVESEMNSGDAAQSTESERIYRIPLGNAWISDKYWIIDGDGNEVQEQEAPAYIELIDLATGEPRYQYLRRYEDTGIRDEWGNPIVKTFCSLYDMNGNQIIDWEEKEYLSAFGEYIIRQDRRGMGVEASQLPKDYQTALYHVPTGAEKYEGIFTITKLDENAFLLCDDWSTPFGTVDAMGEIVSGFPPPKTWYSAYAWNGYFTASLTHPNERTKDETEYLLDKNFRELFSAQWLSGIYGSLKGDYLEYRNAGAYGIYHPEEGIVFSTDGASIEYYDGELAVVQTGSFREGDSINAALVTADHKELAGGFSWLVPAQIYYDEEPAERFIGLREGNAVIIDRTGKVIASVEIPGARSLNVVGKDLYIYHVETDAYFGDGLLGRNLEVLIPVGLYSNFEIIADYKTDYSEWGKNMEKALLRAGKDLGTYETGRSVYRMDILDHTGKVIMDNITDIYDIGPDRIVLKRGFDVGLMDWNGNWIVKRRNFTGFGDD